MTLTYIAPVSPRRALEDCDRRIGILESASSGPAPEVTETANRAQLARLRDLREYHALKVERIRARRIAHSGHMYRVHAELARQHFAEHVALLEGAGHASGRHRSGRQ
jgi:hypothetical protein